MRSTGMELLSGSRWAAKILDKAVSDVPHILVMENDPVFSTALTQAAKFNGVRLTFCNSLMDVRERRAFFDVAIIDIHYGELIGKQLSLLLTKDIPMILTGEREPGTQLRDLPSPYKKFIGKEKGAQAVLVEAVKILGVSHHSMEIGAHTLSKFPGKTKWILAAGLLLLGLSTVTYTFFVTVPEPESESGSIYRWDQAPRTKHVTFS